MAQPVRLEDPTVVVPPYPVPEWKRAAPKPAAPRAPMAARRHDAVTELGYLSHATGAFLSATPDNGVFCLAGVALDAERLTLIPLPPQDDDAAAPHPPSPHPRVALMASSAHLLAVRPGGWVAADAGAVTPESVFVELPVGDGRVWLRHGARGYLSVRAHDGLVCVTDAPDNSATFWPVPRLVLGMATRRHALRALHKQAVALWAPGDSDGGGGGWVTARPLGPLGLGGGDVVHGTQQLLGWELFKLEVLDGAASAVALRSDHGTYLSPQPGGGLRADRTVVGVWERMTLLEDDEGRVALRTCHGPSGGGTFVSARGGAGGGGPVDAAATAVGPRELFVLVSGHVATQRYHGASPLLEEALAG